MEKLLISKHSYSGRLDCANILAKFWFKKSVAVFRKIMVITSYRNPLMEILSSIFGGKICSCLRMLSCWPTFDVWDTLGY